MNVKAKGFCKELFQDFKILPLYSHYNIFYLLLFVINNKDQCKSNQEIHGINAGYRTNLHVTKLNSAFHQKGP
jgi:hypothetical protein